MNIIRDVISMSMLISQLQ